MSSEVPCDNDVSIEVKVKGSFNQLVYFQLYSVAKIDSTNQEDEYKALQWAGHTSSSLESQEYVCQH